LTVKIRYFWENNKWITHLSKSWRRPWTMFISEMSSQIWPMFHVPVEYGLNKELSK
jgi:hypothetical protein